MAYNDFYITTTKEAFCDMEVQKAIEHARQELTVAYEVSESENVILSLEAKENGNHYNPVSKILNAIQFCNEAYDCRFGDPPDGGTHTEYFRPDQDFVVGNMTPMRHIYRREEKMPTYKVVADCKKALEFFDNGGEEEAKQILRVLIGEHVKPIEEYVRES